MPAQQREAKKNYIGIVSDKTDEQHAVASLPKSDRLAKEYLPQPDGSCPAPRRRRQIAVAAPQSTGPAAIP
jgi:hypothetical protein